jgi:hypothetical protein
VGLLSALGLKFNDFIVMNDIADLYGPAADLAVFDIRLASHRHVEDHRDLLSTEGAFEKVFHKLRTCVLTYQDGSCKQSRQQEDQE